MSAMHSVSASSEVLNIIKQINNNVTMKYKSLITDCLSAKANAHLQFQRDFFMGMDKAVQQLIDGITCSVHSNRANHGSNQLIHTIQAHCNKYNQWKKATYDCHIKQMQHFQKMFNETIQNALNQKLMEQNVLVDALCSFSQQRNIGIRVLNRTTFIKTAIRMLNSQKIVQIQTISSCNSI
eukprot:663208_1